MDDLVRKHAITLKPVARWLAIVEEANWQSIHDVWQVFSDADDVGNRRVVFNIKGNNFRVVAVVMYVGNTVTIRWAGTHDEYGKIKDCSIL